MSASLFVRARTNTVDSLERELGQKERDAREISARAQASLEEQKKKEQLTAQAKLRAL